MAESGEERMRGPAAQAEVEAAGEQARQRGPRSRWLRWAPHCAAAIAIFLTLPSLTLGLSVIDDIWQHQLIVDRLEGRGGADPWYAIFDVVASDSARAAQDRINGVRPWWSLDSLRIRFFRPLAVATHYFDNALFPDAHWAMHLHSVLWYGLTCFLVGLLYRRLCGDPRLAVVAACLYAMDDAHISPASWIANRNALVSTCFVLVALIAHDRYRRQGWRRGAWVSPSLWLCALLSAESGLSGGAFFFAYALYFGTGQVHRRVWTIAPHAVVAIAYLISYRMLGYGAEGSGMYLDPFAQTSAVLANAPNNLHFELYHQVSGGTQLVLTFAPWFAPALNGFMVIFVMPALAVYAVRYMGRSRDYDFGMVAGLLALLPYVGLPPHERTLLMPGIGLWLVVARVGVNAIAALRNGEPAIRIAAAAPACIFVLLHVIVSPITLAAGALLFGRTPVAVAATAPTLDDPPLRPEQLVVVLNTVDYHTAILIPAARHIAGLTVASHMYTLGTTPHEVELRTIDDHTLQLKTPFGFIDDDPARFWRSPNFPFRPGDRLDHAEIDVEIVRMTHDGRPQIVRFHFERRLDDPILRFITWFGGAYHEVRPMVGETRLYPAQYDIRATSPFVQR